MRDRIMRHSLTVRLTHWTITISTFLLIFTGIGQMPVYRRYMVDTLPGMAWSSDFSVTLLLHYAAGIVLVSAAIYHIVYHSLRREFDIIPRAGDFRESYLIIKAMLTGGPEPPSRKYLAEQRLAYVFIGGTLALITVTGLVKVIKNLPGIQFSEGLIVAVTLIHNIATFMIIAGIVAHLGAFIVKANRALLPGMFTGWVDADYARHRHSLWFEELCRNDSLPPLQRGCCSDKRGGHGA